MKKVAIYNKAIDAKEFKATKHLIRLALNETPFPCKGYDDKPRTIAPFILDGDPIDQDHFYRRRIHIRESKSGKSRSIPINETASKTLAALPRYLDSSWVFWIGKRGDVRKDVKSAWTKAVKKAGIPNFRFHDLRHTAASWMVMSGMDLYTVQKILGHASIQMTERYSHLAPEHLAQKMKAFELVGPK
jgi:integrase